MADQEESVARNPSTVVIIIIRKLIPSIPRWYCAPMEGIHSARSTNLKSSSGVSLENQKTSGREIRKPTKVAIFPTHRMAFLFSGGTRKRAITPRSGVNRIIVKIWSR